MGTIRGRISIPLIPKSVDGDLGWRSCRWFCVQPFVFFEVVLADCAFIRRVDWSHAGLGQRRSAGGIAYVLYNLFGHRTAIPCFALGNDLWEPARWTWRILGDARGYIGTQAMAQGITRRLQFCLLLVFAVKARESMTVQFSVPDQAIAEAHGAGRAALILRFMTRLALTGIILFLHAGLPSCTFEIPRCKDCWCLSWCLRAQLLDRWRSEWRLCWERIRDDRMVGVSQWIWVHWGCLLRRVGL